MKGPKPRGRSDDGARGREDAEKGRRGDGGPRKGAGPPAPGRPGQAPRGGEPRGQRPERPAPEKPKRPERSAPEKPRRPERPAPARAEKGERRGETRRGLSIPTPLEVISGRNAVREALRAGRRVRRLLLVRGGRRDELVEDAVRLARERQLPVQEVDEEELLFLGAEHQGMAAIVSPFPYASWGDFLEGLKGADHPPAVLLLDTLQDPQNLGTLMRTAEALRIDGVVLPKRRSVQVTPAVVRSSAGAVEHMAVAQVPNLVRAVQDLKRAGLWVAGLDVSGDRYPWDLDMTGPTALLLGGEDHGIGQLLKEQCDFMIRLPMRGEVNSLNAAVAGSVVLYEMERQRGKS